MDPMMVSNVEILDLELDKGIQQGTDGGVRRFQDSQNTVQKGCIWLKQQS
jgi:hypothetical protein